MSQRTQTIEIRTDRPDRVALVLAGAAHPDFQSGLLFVSGALVSTIDEISRQLAKSSPTVNWLILPAMGVLSERGEIERDSAATALLLSNRVQSFVEAKADHDFGQRVCAALTASPGSSAFVSLRNDAFDHGWLQFVDQYFKKQCPPVFGGGLSPQQSAYSIDDGVVRIGAAACAIMSAKTTGRFRSSSACRLISPLRSVTKARGLVVQELEGKLALERLCEATTDLSEQPLVMIAIATGEEPLSKRGRSLALRTIHGVDPERGTLIFDEPIPIGARVAFAVRDAHASRVDLEAQLTALRLDCAGASPDFGIFVNCAGRGHGLYGTNDVDVRLIKKAFPGMPLIGMHSTFELAPLEGKVVSHIYTAVVGVFCRPS